MKRDICVIVFLFLLVFLLSSFFEKDGALFLSLQSFLSSFLFENDGDDAECEAGPGFALLLSLFVVP